MKKIQCLAHVCELSYASKHDNEKGIVEIEFCDAYRRSFKKREI